MKIIAIDCKNIALYNGGISSYFKPLLRDLIEKMGDHYFVLVTPSNFDVDFLDGYSNFKIKRLFRSLLPSHFLNSVIYDCITFPLALRKLKPDVLYSPYYDFVIPKSLSLRSFVTVHDMCFWEVSSRYKIRTRLYHEFLLRRHHSQKVNILSVSETSARSLQTFFGIKTVAIVYNSIAERQTSVQSYSRLDSGAPSEPYVLYAGGVEERKNVDRLLEVFVKILREQLGLKLVITGRSGLSAPLRSKIEYLGLAESVVVTGHISSSELDLLYCNCRLVVNVSLCEGFGRSNLEAMSHGKKLLCSDIAINREFMGDYPTYCDPYSKDDIFMKMRNLLLDSVNDYSPVDVSDLRFEQKKNSETLLELISTALN